jgi:Zinc carboxypeptidase
MSLVPFSSVMCGLAAALMLLTPGGRVGAQGSGAKPLVDLKTRPERTEYKETSHYDDVVAFLDAAAKASPAIHVTSFGKTFEGRTLPLAVVGAPDATPEAVKRTNKLRVYIQGNIHAGEVEGKESAQILIRELAEGKHADWLRSMVLIIAPIYNADGNERFSLTNRGRQNGPVAGQGQRPNAQNYDLNRDHMKLDSPEARAFVKLMSDYDPQVAMDLHTTNGTRHGYYLTYAPPLNPATDPSIIDLLRKDWLPSVTKVIKSKYSWDYYYYGNIETAGGERAWRSFDDRPRFNNSYIGLRNRVAILSEAYAYATFEDRIKATSRFVEEVLNYASAHAAPIKKLTAEADRRTVVGSKLALRAEMEKSADAVEILVGEVTEEKNPLSGAMMNRRSDVVKPEKMPEYGTFKATETERVPAAYYVPAQLTKAIENLRAHGIVMTPLKTAQTVQIEQFTIETSKLSERAFEGHNERTLTGSWGLADKELPAGTLRIDMKQPLRVLPDRATFGRRSRGLEPAGRSARRGRAGVPDCQDAELSAPPSARADGKRSSGDGRSARKRASATAGDNVD